MKASELIAALQKLIAEYGDLEALYHDNGSLADVKLVSYMREYSLPPIFVIS